MPAQVTPQLLRAGVDFKYDFFLGVYVLDPRQDIATHSGVPSLRKRIIRRLLTTPGGFFHLPDYGVGLQVKGTLNSTKLGKLKAQIQQQILAEDDVETASTDLAFFAPGVLVVSLRVKPKGEDAFSMTVEVPEHGPVVLS